MKIQSKQKLSLFKPWVLGWVVALLPLVSQGVDNSGFSSSKGTLCSQSLRKYEFKQGYSTVAENMRKADEDYPAFSRFVQEVAELFRGKQYGTNIKSAESISAKENGSGRSPDDIMDYLRDTIIFENMEDLLGAYDYIKGQLRVASKSNYFLTPKGPRGYRAFHLYVETSPNFIAEIQLHLEKIFEFKQTEGDRLYKQIGNLKGKLKLEGSPADRAEIAAEIQRLEDAHLKGMNDAWLYHLRQGSKEAEGAKGL